MRQKARRHAHVRIRNGLDVDRRQPTDDEIQDLLEGISRNAVPKFGLVKLSAMRLDDGVEPPAWFERIIRWPKGELIPMVHLAALRRRDAILVQLLRAGAAPFTRLGGDENGDHDEEETLSRRARTFLAGLRTPHATWLVVVAAHMRLRAVAASQAVCRNDREPAPADVCNRCGQTGHWAKDCERPKNANAPLRESRTEPNASDVCNGCGGTGHWFRDCPAAAERVKGEETSKEQSRCSACGKDEPSRPMTFGACGHVACEPCAWRHLLDRYERRGDGSSSGDGSAKDEDGDRAVSHRGEGIPADAEWTCPGCAALEVFDERDDDDDDLTRLYAAAPGTIAAESKRRWLELSPVVKRLRGGGDPKNGKSSKRFVGLGPRACARLRLGTSRPKRTEALIAAAQHGDARRIRAIVAAGCDVNCSDEYGLTPLMWAGWRGKAIAADALLRSGADPARTARGGGGVTASVAASAAGHVRLAATLRVAEDDAGTSIASLTVDWDSDEAGKSESRAVFPVKTLVDPAMDHPGANHSFIVDGAVPEHVLTRLERTWEASTREAAAAVDAALSEESDEVVERIRSPTDDCSAADAAAAEAARAKAIAEATDARSMERKRSDTCATRAHFCDVRGWARAAVLKAARASGMPARGVHPQFRILHYPNPGGVMAPHVDLSKALDPVDSTWSGEGAEVAGSKPALATTHTFLLYLRTCDAGGETALLREVKSAAGAAGAVGAESLAEVKPLRGRLLVFPHECPHAGRPVVDTNKLVLRGELW